MDYHQPQQSEEEEEEIPFWKRPPSQDDSKEKLIEQIKQIQLAQKNTPRWPLFKKMGSVIYLILNLILLYWSIGTPIMGYAALYMIPLSIMLADYLLTIGRIERISKGEPEK